jgi:alpha,alpha-trehalase
MKRFLASSAILCFLTALFSQVFPDKDYPILFNDIQTSGYFPDSKTFPDCIPLMNSKKIDSCYRAEKSMPGFKQSDFINTYFVVPQPHSATYNTDTTQTIEQHLESLWAVLEKQPQQAEGSLLYLPNRYIVPGGRFQEVYYWDSYFTMLGLKESGKTELIQSMIDNFAYLIDRYGHIPNGNRTYYLSRSQPPFFSLMIDLLADINGDEVYKKYLPQLVKEYQFWMDGAEKLSANNNSYRRVVLLSDGVILNRYWDDDTTPRPEAYKEDLKIAALSPEPDSVDFRNIRAAAESGWDFSSRWLNDGLDLETIETTKILPIDLNCLLYHLETTISKAYKLSDNKAESKKYFNLATTRKKAIQNYFWRKKEGFFVDYHWVLEWQNMPNQLAGIYPLFFNIASKKQAAKCAKFIETNFLKDGGLQTTTKTTGQQWDSPNGWAPLQYISIIGLENYKKKELADTIRQRWLRLNTNVFKKTGKFCEKYNVVNTDLPGGGGEYPSQDGFGWTNGVYLKLKHTESTR